MSFMGPSAQQNPWGSPNNPWGSGAVPQRAMMPAGYPAGQAAYAPASTKPAGSASRVLRGLLLIVAVFFCLIVIDKVMSGTSGTTDFNPPAYNPPATTSTTAPTTSTQPVQPNQPPPPGGYQNADYQVPDPNLNPPDLPMPDTYDEATTWMTSNVFYNQPIPVPVECQIPSINPSTASKSDLQTYLNDAVACLMRVWGPQLQSAGFNASRPSVTVYTGQVQSPCGKMPNENALYCSADQQVYYATDLPDLFPSQASDPMVPVAVIAHEFGHAIQAQSGILYSETAWQQDYSDSGDDASANDLSRRTEQQADCFAGAFLQAISQSVGVSSNEQAALGQVFYSIGDDVLSGDPNIDGDHGWGAHRLNWLNTGLAAQVAGNCNTFAASVSSDQVR